MKSKKIDERNLTRNFLKSVLKEDYSYNYNYDYNAGDQSNNELRYDNVSVINPEDLHSHFDEDGDGITTTDDYANHIDYHCAHPETLDKYRNLSSESLSAVPCENSYNACGSYCMSDPESMQSMLQPIMSTTGASCHTSALHALLNVVKAMKDCGLL